MGPNPILGNRGPGLLGIPESINERLPTMVKNELARLPPQKQGEFLEEFQRKQKSIGVAYLLWFVLGLHYLYINKIGAQFFYWITAGGLLIWTIVDLFRLPKIIDDYNRDVAIDVLRDLKTLSS